MLRERWQGRVFLLIVLWNASGTSSLGGSAILPSENSPSDFAKIVQSKQTKQARVCGADHQVLRSLANTGVEVMLSIPNEQLQHMAEFREEAELWVATNVVRFLPATKITHVLAGSDVLASSPGSACFLVPAMLNLHTALVAARLDGRVRVSSALSGLALAPAASSAVTARLLRFLRDTGSPFFLKPRPSSEATDARVDDVYGAMRALNFSGIPLIAEAGSEEVGAGAGAALVYHSYLQGRPGEGRRRSLATGTFCVALQSADPTALQAGLSWACGQANADCSAIQPGGACYKQNNLAALASYAYNDYYQKSSSTGATCSFNGTATTTTTDPSSGSCVFAGSTMAGGSNSSVPSASPPTSLTPPSGLTPPFGSSPPSDFGPPAAGTAPPTSFGPPAGGFGTPSGFSPPSGFGTPPGFGPPSGSGPPSAFGPPGSATFGPSSTLNPYGSGCRHVPSSSVLVAVVLAALLASIDLM